MVWLWFEIMDYESWKVSRIEVVTSEEVPGFAGTPCRFFLGADRASAGLPRYFNAPPLPRVA